MTTKTHASVDRLRDAARMARSRAKTVRGMVRAVMRSHDIAHAVWREKVLSLGDDLRLDARPPVREPEVLWCLDRSRSGSDDEIDALASREVPEEGMSRVEAWRCALAVAVAHARHARADEGVGGEVIASRIHGLALIAYYERRRATPWHGSAMSIEWSRIRSDARASGGAVIDPIGAWEWISVCERNYRDAVHSLSNRIVLALDEHMIQTGTRAIGTRYEVRSGWNGGWPQTQVLYLATGPDLRRWWRDEVSAMPPYRRRQSLMRLAPDALAEVLRDESAAEWVSSGAERIGSGVDDAGNPAALVHWGKFRFLRCRCTGTQRLFMLRVPSRIETVDEAVDWLRPEECRGGYATQTA